jgi:hypothetical protein
VFVSYAHEDKPIARFLADALKSAGCRVWIDEGELRVGDSLVWKVSEAIRGAGFVVALVSQHSLASRWCQKELGMAVHNQLRDGRFVLQPITCPPERLAGVNLVLGRWRLRGLPVGAPT